jgi:hypothetical protein
MNNLKYKINKYLSKYEKEDIFLKKMLYAKKFLLYLEEYNKNIDISKISDLDGGGLKEDIQDFTSKLDVIKLEINKVKPIYDLVVKHDNLLKLICPKYSNYTSTNQLIEYYSKIHADIEQNFGDL